MNFSLHDIMYRSKIYSVAVAFRQYFGITRNGRFGVFNEVDLGFSSGHTDFTRPYNNELKNTHTDVGKLELGFKMTDTHTYSDQIYESERSSKSANFRINLFSISFGVTFYL